MSVDVVSVLLVCVTDMPELTSKIEMGERWVLELLFELAGGCDEGSVEARPADVCVGEFAVGGPCSCLPDVGDGAGWLGLLVELVF